MRCAKCGLENEAGSKFCLGCGERLEVSCPQCGHRLSTEAHFCRECGLKLSSLPPPERVIPQAESGRKYITVLFSDLCGYTSLSERLDPEEVKEITSRIFEEISKVVAKYGGVVEHFAGDGVMALFGVPQVHEDDPLRAIKAAREIHQFVGELGKENRDKLGQPMAMHSGINTGLVVTGEMDARRGTHGVAGDTINVASRLCDLAKADQILIDEDTRSQAEGHFAFEALKPASLKGKAEPVPVFRVVSPRDQPVTVHRLSGLKADLVGRKAELAELREAVQNLHNGRGRFFSICGDAGTGKSRLVEEFKASLDPAGVQWLEGHAYAYSQNIPYFPLIDLLNRVLGIDENDPPSAVREKVESGIEQLLGKAQNAVPYVGRLFSLVYPEVENISPEFWRSHLQEAVKAILEALAKRAPTIFFLEDLHWVDPSFAELIRSACLEFRQPAIFLCTFRPPFSLFTSPQLSSIGNLHTEIRLEDLPPSEAQDMLESLLKSERLPSKLRRLVQNKAGGNPFYLEELVNSLIESETLVRDNDDWKIAGLITASAIPSSIHGLISSRLDRLDTHSRRVLQEASVMGRTFLHEILTKITTQPEGIDRSLGVLLRLDLIRVRSLQPDLEYMFKHPLIQEVVYNGLLIKDRKEIHERIARIMEDLFQDRLPEFYETLAFHFQRGLSVLKAINYLIWSGEKSLARYAVQESHQYFQEAFDLLSRKASRTKAEDALLIELLIKWSQVYYYRATAGEQEALLRAHEELAKTLEDKPKLGMFYAWLGWAAWFREKYEDSLEYLHKALDIGQDIGDQHIIGYACNWLCWTLAERGALEEAIRYGERARRVSGTLPADPYLFFKSVGGIGYANFYMGNRAETLEAGKILLGYGRKHSNVRSLVMGHFMVSLNFLMAGDFSSATEAARQADQTAQDPLYSVYSSFLLGICYAQSGRFEEAGEVLLKADAFCRDFGLEFIGTPNQALLGLALVVRGEVEKGLRLLEEALEQEIKAQRKFWEATIENTLGQIYLQAMDKNGPSAAARAGEYFQRAARVAREIGAKGVEGQAYLGLGCLHKVLGTSAQSQDFFSKAGKIFEEHENEGYLKQTREAAGIYDPALTGPPVTDRLGRQ